MRQNGKDYLDWEPGTDGKGIVDEKGGVHTWAEDEYPFHHNYEDQHGNVRGAYYFWIYPDGKVESSGLHPHLLDQYHQCITDADERLKPSMPDWGF